MRWLAISFLILIQISFIYAVCKDGQIDINTAEKEELTELIYIGEVRADRIIESRPFSSLDELTKVNGIGEVILEKIKEQGLACVKNEDNKDENKNKEDVNQKDAEKNDTEYGYQLVGETIAEDNTTKPEIIKLSSKQEKSIKNENDIEKIDKSSYAIYGFFAFCILLGVLFLLRRKKYKNEFERI